ncbi:MAG: twitching motility protein PilT [Betaproteobacteria bacterium HGW-Betaproteobacteria-10]|nr:MAG: twitching motility protein PilT [Betaproteobacteria bacterium HGW-Betaproteobacteria-10]
MTPQILDTSALLAYLWEEPGEARVAHLLTTERCFLGATNLAELISKVIERGLPENDVPTIVNSLNVEIVPLTQAQAELSGILRQSTRHLGLSLGDRACLALTKTLGGIAITADRPWLALDIGINVECIRPDAH